MTQALIREVKTKEIIVKMLKEPTGRHFLDSGDFYGRHWKRNQARDFEKEPYGRLEVELRDGHLSLTLEKSTYWHLVETLTYAEDLDKEFHAWAEEQDPDAPWLELMEEWLEERFEDKPRIVNTYNHESFLDQVLQYAYVDDVVGFIIVLQIHNGCDVRGGYTTPHVFFAESTFFHDDMVTIRCPECGPLWDVWSYDVQPVDFPVPYDKMVPVPVENVDLKNKETVARLKWRFAPFKTRSGHETYLLPVDVTDPDDHKLICPKCFSHYLEV